MPFLTFELEAAMTNQRFMETLKSAVYHSDWLVLSKGTLPFHGTVSENGFRIMRTYRGRNSFIPIIFGRFLDSIQGTRVRVIMTFHPIIWLFIIVWPFLIQSETPFRFASPSFIGILFLLAPLIMGIPFFFYEAAKSKKLLFQTLGLNSD